MIFEWSLFHIILEFLDLINISRITSKTIINFINFICKTDNFGFLHLHIAAEILSSTRFRPLIKNSASNDWYNRLHPNVVHGTTGPRSVGDNCSCMVKAGLAGVDTRPDMHYVRCRRKFCSLGGARTGATSNVTCGLCQPGTYQTGSGQPWWPEGEEYDMIR